MKLSHALAICPILALGCSRDSLYADADFNESVASAFSDCQEGEIRFLTNRQNLKPVFRVCGSNNFAHFSWSPDGSQVYFELTHGGYIMDVAAKSIQAVPTPGPEHRAAWLDNERLLLPLGPTEEEPGRLAVYTRPTRSDSTGALHTVTLDVTQVRDVGPWTEEGKVLFTALGEEGVRKAWLANLGSGDVEQVFDWLPSTLERLTFTPGAPIIAASSTDETWLYQTDGTLLEHIPGAQRAIPHPGGRYVAIETPGDPISPFDQRAWDEISPEARERELARQERWLENLPEWIPRELHPPELQILDRQSDSRYRITAFYGDHFEWLPAEDHFCSFILWGVEGKQLNRNVVYTNLGGRLREADRGEAYQGLERIETGTVVENSLKSVTEIP
ncbi:MAG: hypothetical protein QGG40_05150 [Myxococcota bacterium]|nr:hypothetical protein [Myxococcota bacterium]